MAPTQANANIELIPSASNVLLDDANLVRLSTLVGALTQGHSSVAIASGNIALLQHHALALTQALRDQAQVQLAVQPYAELDTMLAQFNALVSRLAVQDARKPAHRNAPTQVWLMQSAEQYSAETLQALQRVVHDFPAVKLQLAFVFYGDLGSSPLSQWPNLWCWPIEPIDAAHAQVLRARAAEHGLSREAHAWLERSGIALAPRANPEATEPTEGSTTAPQRVAARRVSTLGWGVLSVAAAAAVGLWWLDQQAPSVPLPPSEPAVQAPTPATEVPADTTASTQAPSGLTATPRQSASQAASTSHDATPVIDTQRQGAATARTSANVARPEAIPVSPQPAPARAVAVVATPPAPTPEASMPKPVAEVRPPSANARPDTPATAAQAAPRPAQTSKSAALVDPPPGAPRASAATSPTHVPQATPAQPTTTPQRAAAKRPALSELAHAASTKGSSNIQVISTEAQELLNFATPSNLNLTALDDNILPAIPVATGAKGADAQAWVQTLPDARWLIEHARLDSPEAAALWAGSHPGLEHARMVTLRGPNGQARYALVTGPFTDQAAARSYAKQVMGDIVPVFLRGEELKRAAQTPR